MTKEQQLTANAKHAMFSPVSAIIQTTVIFSIMGLFTFLLNKWSLERDRDPAAGTLASYDRWRVRFENLSGPGIFVYVVLLTDARTALGHVARRHLVFLDLGPQVSSSARATPCSHSAS